MKRKIIYIFFMIMFLFPTLIVNAECSDKELKNLKGEVKNIKITYKHLGEVIKDNGSKAYNEFLVTAKNIPDNVYVHLYPFTSENFEETDEGLKITLTTGEWNYNLYSSICDSVVDTITIKLPRFNLYSLDPLCENVDGNDFKLCGKYYELEVSRESFEQRVKEYRKAHKLDEIEPDKKEDEKENIFYSILNKILAVLKEYYIYILSTLLFIAVVVVIILLILKRGKRKVLK